MLADMDECRCVCMYAYICIYYDMFKMCMLRCSSKCYVKTYTDCKHSIMHPQTAQWA